MKVGSYITVHFEVVSISVYYKIAYIQINFIQTFLLRTNYILRAGESVGGLIHINKTWLITEKKILFLYSGVELCKTVIDYSKLN